MKPRLGFLLGLALTVAAFTEPAHAQTPASATMPATATMYVVTYLEVGPALVVKAASILRKLSVASRKEDGNLGFVALRERDRPGRFAIVEAWRDKAALDAHNTAAKATLDLLQPLQASPPDPRLSNELAVAPKTAAEPGNKGNLYVVTHVDVPPPVKDEAIALVRQLAEDSRKDDGNLRFDVVQQTNRPNHMTVVEAWQERVDRNAHVMVDHTRDFRRKLTPLHGALYDERLYEPVR